MPFSKHFRDAHPAIASNDWLRATLCASGRVGQFIYQKTWPRLANRRNFPGDTQQRRRLSPINPGYNNPKVLLARQAMTILAQEYRSLTPHQLAYWNALALRTRVPRFSAYTKRHFQRVYRGLLAS